MKRIKMKTIMASAIMTANIGDAILVDDDFADQLIKSKSAELIEDIPNEILEEVEQEVEIKQEPQKKSKKKEVN